MIDQALPVLSFYKTNYDEKVDSGQQYLLNQKIVIVGLCRNAETYIQQNIQQIVSLLENKCADYRIVLFENDSVDSTKNKINELIDKNNKIILLSKNFNRPQFGTVKDVARTTALAEYRNILKDYVKNYLADFNFTIVMDTDFKDFSITGIYSSFGWLREHNNIEAMCGNSFEIKKVFGPQDSLWNYDCWAYRGTWWHDWQNYPLSEYQNYNQMGWFGLWILPPGSPPVRINSGFGGCCIYRTKSFIQADYSGDDCEHVVFHYDLYQKNPNFNLCLNPAQVMLLK